MKKFIALTGCFVFLYFFQSNNCYAQAYIQYSHQDSGRIENNIVKVVDGEAYLLRSRDFSGSVDATLKKYAVDGSLIYSRDITLEESGITAMEVINGEVYLLAAKPKNTIFIGGAAIQAIKVLANGSIAFSRVISDTTSTNVINPGCEVSPEIIISGNEWIISALVSGYNFPTTMGGLVPGYRNLFLVKLNATTGAINRSMGISGGPYSCCELYNSSKVVVENGYLYTAMSSQNNDLPVTIGNLPTPGSFGTRVYVRKMNLADFSTVFSRYLTVDSLSRVRDFLVKNGEYHITGTFYQSAFYTKLYADGSLALTTGLDISPDHIEITSSHAYISGNGAAYKLNFDGSIVYEKHNPVTTGNILPPYQMPMKVVGEDLYIAGFGAAPNYPITNNSAYMGGLTGYVTHYGPSGNVVFSSFVTSVSGMQVENNKIYLAGDASQPINASTDSSQINGTSDCSLTV